MGFGEKLGATLATKYGVVTSGKYKDCQIALGNPPDQKVTTSYSFSQIIFVDGSEEKGRYDIVKVRMLVHGKDEKGVKMSFQLEDGEICEFDLLLKQEEKFAVKLLKSFLGGGNKGSANEAEQKFHNVVVFFRTVLAVLVPKDVDFFEEYFRVNGVLDDLTKKLIVVYRSKMGVDNQ